MTRLSLSVQRRMPSDPVLWGAAVMGLLVSIAIVHPLSMVLSAVASQACVAGIGTVWDLIATHLREEFTRPMRPMTAGFAVIGAGVSGTVAWTSLRLVRRRYTLALRSHDRSSAPELLPLCAWCHKVRDDRGEWRRIERYLADRIHVQCTHHVCPECAASLLAEADRVDATGAAEG